MMLLLVITILFLALMLFPFLLARSSIQPGKTHSLVVKSDNVRDPRYFSKAFGALMERALRDYDGGGRIRLSKSETLVEPPLPEVETIDAVVFAGGNFMPAGAHTFEKEIYCRADACLPAETHLRAITCLGALTFSEGCVLDRWADGAHSMTVGAGCRLGVSASSAHRLTLHLGCTFRRLYAPEITFGEVGEPFDFPEPARCEEIHRDIGEAADFERIEGDVISPNDFMVGEDAVITGSLKTRRHVHVRNGARILGNLIAEGNVVLETGVFVAGIVFSQSSVYIGPGCQVGRVGRIKSVVARGSVVIAEGARVFGYISGEADGCTAAVDEYYGFISDKY